MTTIHMSGTMPLRSPMPPMVPPLPPGACTTLLQLDGNFSFGVVGVFGVLATLATMAIALPTSAQPKLFLAFYLPIVVTCFAVITIMMMALLSPAQCIAGFRERCYWYT